MSKDEMEPKTYDEIYMLNYADCPTDFWLREIAAQLAALNEMVFAVKMSIDHHGRRNPWKPRAPRIKPK